MGKQPKFLFVLYQTKWGPGNMHIQWRKVDERRIRIFDESIMISVFYITITFQNLSGKIEMYFKERVSFFFNFIPIWCSTAFSRKLDKCLLKELIQLFCSVQTHTHTHCNKLMQFLLKTFKQSIKLDSLDYNRFKESILSLS